MKRAVTHSHCLFLGTAALWSESPIGRVPQTIGSWAPLISRRTRGDKGHAWRFFSANGAAPLLAQSIIAVVNERGKLTDWALPKRGESREIWTPLGKRFATPPQRSSVVLCSSERGPIVCRSKRQHTHPEVPLRRFAFAARGASAGSNYCTPAGRSLRAHAPVPLGAIPENLEEIGHAVAGSVARPATRTHEAGPRGPRRSRVAHVRIGSPKCGLKHDTKGRKSVRPMGQLRAAPGLEQGGNWES